MIALIGQWCVPQQLSYLLQKSLYWSYISDFPVSLYGCCLYSNIGGATINDVALDFWHSGQNREDIGMEDLEHRLRAETIESQGNAAGFQKANLCCCDCWRWNCDLVLFLRWLRSERAHVGTLGWFLCAVSPSGVPTCQALCTWCLCSAGPGPGWSDAGRGGQSDAVRPQRRKTVLSPGMQVHTSEDQLLPPVGAGVRPPYQPIRGETPPLWFTHAHSSRTDLLQCKRQKPLPEQCQRGQCEPPLHAHLVWWDCGGRLFHCLCCLGFHFCHFWRICGIHALKLSSWIHLCPPPILIIGCPGQQCVSLQ